MTKCSSDYMSFTHLPMKPIMVHILQNSVNYNSKTRITSGDDEVSMKFNALVFVVEIFTLLYSN